MNAAIMFASAAALAVQPAQAVPQNVQSSPEAVIGAQLERWMEAFEACDAQALSNLFTHDGVYAANTGQVLIGRDAIRNGVQGWMTGPLKPACRGTGASLNVERRMVRLNVLGDAAYTLTRFIIRVDPLKCTIDAGHILGVWRRQPSGAWVLEALAGNKDPVQPPNPCP